MNIHIPLIWFVAMGIAIGLFLGYTIGMLIGVSRGRQQLIKKIRLLVSREKIDFDIDKLLHSKNSKLIKEDFL
jgi:hypothetical protein